MVSSSRAIFIDLDMTLVDTSQGLMIAVSRVGSEYGVLEIPVDTDPRMFMKIYYKERIPGIKDPMERWRFWRSVWMIYLEERIYGKPMPCSESLLLASSGRRATAIVTGREVGAWSLAEELRSYGFPIEVVRVYTTGDLWPGATKRDLYEQLALKYSGLGIPRERVVVITDSPKDVRLAREAGFQVVGYIPFNDPEVVAMLAQASRGITVDTLCTIEDLISKS